MEGGGVEAEGIVVSEFGGPSVLEFKKIQLRNIGPVEVLVAIKAVGVNPVETYIRSGTYARKPQLPYTPGADGAGVVEAVGEAIKHFKVGDRVYLAGSITGTYASKTLAKEHNLHKLPDNVSFAQGATLSIPYATAYRALVQFGNAKADETVFVHGASGGVGIASVQLARARGLRVIGTASTEKGRELVLREGAHYVFDHKSADYVEKIKELAKDNGGVDIILEMLANVNLSKDFSLLAHRGRVGVIGSRGTIEINPRDLMFQESSVFGVALGQSSPAELDEAHAAIYAGLENGTLRPVVGEEIPLAQAAKAHEDIMSSTHFGNIVLIP